MVTKNMGTMKKIFVNTILLIGLSVLFALNACKDDISPVIDELTYNRAFTPVGLKAQISNITTVTLSWTAVKNVDHYTVEIYTGTDFTEANMIYTMDAYGTTINYSLPSGDTQFSARIKSISSVGATESNWTTVAFKSDPENLFLGYKVTMTGLGAVTVKWAPGKAVTKLLFINNSVELPFDVTADEAAAGSKIVTGLTNGNNEIRIMNGVFVRGKQFYQLEGDVLLSATDDFVAAVAALKAGGVMIVAPNISVGFDGPITFTKSIKIRGIDNSSMPTIFVKSYPSQAHMFTIGTTLTNADSIVFQDITFSGYINNIVSTAKSRGIFDQQLAACAVGAIKFKGCIMRNFERHVVRLRGDFSQVIGTIEMDKCVMYDFAFASNYGVINSSAALGTINNIKITNSTIYYIRGAIIAYSNGTACQGITISNCTFNQLAQDATTARYVIDMNSTVSTGNINITNCLFGNTGTLCSGFRPNTMTLNMTNCYYATDFNEAVTSTGKSKMTGYSGASTALWSDPLAGVFTIKDATFAGKNSAGDPRWR